MINLIHIGTLFASMLVSGCASGIFGNGHLVSEHRSVTNPIHYVVVKGAFNATVHRDKKESIEVQTDSNLLPHVSTTMRGGTLTIEPKSSIRNGTINIFIATENLKGLDVRGASKAEIDYSSKNGFSISSSGASRITGTLQTTDAVLNLTGASHIDLQGSCNSLTARANGSSKLDLQQSQITNMTVEDLSGASKLMLPSLQRLEVKRVSGASKITYQGNPQLTLGKIIGASTIRRQD
ncbi:MAG: DUF2807 domain-containing protein [Myxococcota bacterium]